MKPPSIRAILAALGISALMAFAQTRGDRPRMYDPATETTIRGTVDQVNPSPRGRMPGTHLMIQSDGTSTEVALGPTNFLKREGFVFEKGDAVEVTGSKVTFGSREFIIAREVIRSGKTLTLRDKDGVPKWAGERRRWRDEPCCSRP